LRGTEGQTQRIREVVRRMEEVAGIAETAAQGAEQTFGRDGSSRLPR